MMIMRIMNAPIDYKRSRVIITEQQAIVIMENHLDVYGATSNVVILGSGLYMTLPYTSSYHINHILRVLCITHSYFHLINLSHSCMITT